MMLILIALIPVSLLGFGLWWAKRDGLDLRNDPGSGIEQLRLSETSTSEDKNHRP
jgi:hypothetical protein